MLFNPVHAEQIAEERARRRVPGARAEFTQAFEARRAAPTALARRPAGARRGPATTAFARPTRGVSAMSRRRRRTLVRVTLGDERLQGVTGDTPTPDVNYVFPDVRHDPAADRDSSA